MSTDQLPDSFRLTGVATTAELAAAGVTEAMIRTMARKGILLRTGRGVYARGTPDLKSPSPLASDRLLMVTAAVRVAGKDAVASHQDAAALHGIDLLDYPSAHVVAVSRPPGVAGSRTVRPGIHLHLAALPASQVTVVRGIRVTSAARTVIDLARTVPFRAGVVAADSALRRKIVSKPELRSVIRTCGRWPRIVRAREVVEFSDGRSESPFESIARVAFRDWGLPPPDLQVWVGGEDEVIGRADFLWREHHTIGEADGAAKYAEPYVARKQLRRDAQLREAGYEVVHFSWRELVATPQQVVRSINAAFRRAAALRRQ